MADDPYHKSWEEMTPLEHYEFLSHLHQPHEGLDRAIKEREERERTEADQWHVPSQWKRLDLADLDSWDVEPLVPIIDGIMARGNIVYVAAETQTGKTLKFPYIARKLLHAGKLYDRFDITPVQRIGYFVLEDPARRIHARMMDTAHEFSPIEPGHLTFHIAPGFKLNDERMFAWLETIIIAEHMDVIFIDTYQKATPGITSFDDEKQSVILHRLTDLRDRIGITIVILDHVRKRQNGGKRLDLTIDDIRGTGAKAQNADTVILMDRTADKKQIKFQAYPKDWDKPIRILLNVAPRGSKEPKFTYAGDLEQLGADSKAKGAANRQKVLDCFLNTDRLSTSEVANRTGLSEPTSRSHLRHWLEADKLDSCGKGPARRYWLKSADEAKA